MTSKSKTKTPANVCAAAKILWRDVTAEYELDAADLAILHEACVQLTRAHDAAAQVKKHGVVVSDRWQQLRENPAVAIERQATNQFRLLLRELGLDVDDGLPDERGRLPRGKRYTK